MRIPFTKMQGAGNDFIVLDATQTALDLSTAQYRWLADRRFGVGADQILIVGPSPAPGIDFSYRIVNADGGEVAHCGNGARCFVRYVRERGLTEKTTVTVRTLNADLVLTEHPDGTVTVDMGEPRFDAASLPFVAVDCARVQKPALPDHPDWPVFEQFTFTLAKKQEKSQYVQYPPPLFATFNIAIASMGNPHAVIVVDDITTAPVHELGAWLQAQPAFPEQVNVGFMQVLSAHAVRLRVFERGAGETLACGTGACAAVACGIRLGLLAPSVQVQASGGVLRIDWAGPGSNLTLSGPATTVFCAHIDIPD